MAILNLSEYQIGKENQNSPLPKSNGDLAPITQKSAQPLLKGLDQKYIDTEFKTDLLQDFDKVTPTKDMAKVASDGAIKAKSNLGNAVGQSAGAVADFASTAVQLNSNVAESDKAADARTGQLALKGMAMGATVGSVIPGVGTVIGAAAGAVIGGTVGMLKKVPDRKKRLNNSNENYNNRLFAMTEQTNKMAENAYIQEELENQKNLAKAQMGLLNLKY